jgi:hypothetical protein
MPAQAHILEVPMQFNRLWPALVVAAGLAACSDRPSAPTAPEESPVTADPSALGNRPGQARLERLARRTARALRDPGFRADVKAALDRSTFREGKVQFQRYLKENGGRGLRVLAAGDGEGEADVDGEVTRAGTLEMYFPVAAHRAAWTGDENVLVATAEWDGDTPIAYDLAGRRIVLSPDTPPSTPVLAVEPAELDFDAPRDVVAAKCTEATCGGGGGGYVIPPTPGLYMTKAEFVESFESWLKGDPEYEIHIMGPAAKGDNTNLVSFQCIGEHAPSPYSWDLNQKTWTGSQLLFSKAQIDAMALAHKNVPFTIMAYEDDDTACQIKTDSDRASKLFAAVGIFAKDYKSAKSTEGKLEAAPSLFKLLAAIYSFLTTADDIIGLVVSDAVTGRYHAGTNWTALNDRTNANAWFQLEMK